MHFTYFILWYQYTLSILILVTCAIVQVDPSRSGETCVDSVCTSIGGALQYADFQDVIELLPGVYKGWLQSFQILTSERRKQ